MLTALVETGFQVTATWPVRASQRQRMIAMGTNAIASYIVLACRRRPADAPQTDRRSFVAELTRELPVALRRLQQGNIAPGGLCPSGHRPGHDDVLQVRPHPGGEWPRHVRAHRPRPYHPDLDEVLSEQEDDFDADTRWAIAWYEPHGFEKGEFGVANYCPRPR